MPILTGLDPVAKLTELNGDLYQLSDYIAKAIDEDDYLLVSVVHGDIYICTPQDDDPYWLMTAEVSQGLRGSWDSETDLLANDLPDEVSIIDVFGGGRYIVEGPYD